METIENAEREIKSLYDRADDVAEQAIVEAATAIRDGSLTPAEVLAGSGTSFIYAEALEAVLLPTFPYLLGVSMVKQNMTVVLRSGETWTGRADLSERVAGRLRDLFDEYQQGDEGRVFTVKVVEGKNPDGVKVKVADGRSEVEYPPVSPQADVTPFLMAMAQKFDA